LGQFSQSLPKPARGGYKNNYIHASSSDFEPGAGQKEAIMAVAASILITAYY
jgi:hypothetical protein